MAWVWLIQHGNVTLSGSESWEQVCGWVWERYLHQLKEIHKKRKEGSFLLLDIHRPRILQRSFQSEGIHKRQSQQNWSWETIKWRTWFLVMTLGGWINPPCRHSALGLPKCKNKSSHCLSDLSLEFLLLKFKVS